MLSDCAATELIMDIAITTEVVLTMLPVEVQLVFKYPHYVQL